MHSPHRSAPRILPVAALLVCVGLLLPLVASAKPRAALSAGVGRSDRALHREYPLRLTFALAGGAYVANLEVTVRDASGAVVLHTTAAGPWLFVDLPPGAYGVQAVRKTGAAASARCTLVADGQTVCTLVWAKER